MVFYLTRFLKKNKIQLYRPDNWRSNLHPHNLAAMATSDGSSSAGSMTMKQAVDIGSVKFNVDTRLVWLIDSPRQECYKAHIWFKISLPRTTVVQPSCFFCSLCPCVPIRVPEPAYMQFNEWADELQQPKISIIYLYTLKVSIPFFFSFPPSRLLAEGRLSCYPACTADMPWCVCCVSHVHHPLW